MSRASYSGRLWRVARVPEKLFLDLLRGSLCALCVSAVAFVTLSGRRLSLNLPAMPVRRAAIHPTLALLLLLAATGCQGPRPARAFVDQARRLHTDALVSAVDRQPDLAE